MAIIGVFAIDYDQKEHVMRTIAILGAGQAGLQLALGLQRHGYSVTLLTDRTPEQIRAGSVMSTQCMFHDALEAERELGLNLWEETCPPVSGMAVQIAGPDGTPALAWKAPLDQPAQSVDQRLKLPAWLELFAERGGSIRYASATIDDLEQLTLSHDLVVVAAGKGAINQLFPRDAERSPYAAPQRVIALVTVHGMQPVEPYDLVSFNIIPGVGEFFVLPSLGASGTYHNLLFEAIPGGPLDCWGDITTPESHLARALECLERWLPWEAGRCANVTLTDAKGVLRGQFAPTVRHAVGRLPSGRAVLGMADAVVLNDPLTGQGSNNAAKCAAIYLERILAHADAPFDAEWMQASFDRFWEYASYVTQWSNAMLAPPPPHIIDILGAASQAPALAQRFVNGFNNPPAFFPWLVDPAVAQATIEQEMALLA
jgi:2-polyprenyl-6-methoxyphenol hydroxylase-like FAD-dependent oxidoreductase